mmetsp:Transcript_128272/g.399342  ORF Transcript_128272/g.399342 Transcript_128272/m.399342 type:complete len:249 (-) Transcript_128272:225-971(-)
MSPGSQALRMLLPAAALATVWLGMEASGAHDAIARRGATVLASAVLRLKGPSSVEGHSNLRSPVLMYDGEVEEQPQSSSPAMKFAVNYGYYIEQLIYGLIYFALIARNYPKFEGSPTKEARRIMAVDEMCALGRTTCSNSCLACCCAPGRAAHTLDSTGIMSFWKAFVLMVACPCCTLCYASSCTDMCPKLGGEKRGACPGCMCALFCMCCTIARDATALDLNTKVHTGCCGVSDDDDSVEAAGYQRA